MIVTIMNLITKLRPELNLNWGLKDIEYFDQSVDILKTVDQPFLRSFSYFNEPLSIYV